MILTKTYFNAIQRTNEWRNKYFDALYASSSIEE